MIEEYANTHQDYKTEEDEEEEPIRPSIPSIIPLKSHDNAIARTSSPRTDGDDCSRSSVSSLISEVTLMTFSEEKAAMLRSEFISRVEQNSHTRPLSRDEKLALLTEIQADQDKKFKVEMRRQETKRNMKREGKRTKHEFFERLNALRVNNGIDIIKTVQKQQQQQLEGDQIDTSEYTNTSESGGGGGQEEVDSSDNGAQNEEKKKERQGPCRRETMMRKQRRASCLSSSDITEKRCNSNRTLLRGSCGNKDEPNAIATASSSSANSDSEGSTQTNTTKRAAIEELIAHKMEIANQQATIDTITARLHNLEINNSKLSSSLSQEKGARKAAEKSNEELTEQLRKCRESEIELRREVMALSTTRPPMMKQSSTVDWGDANESDLVDRIKELEQENEELSRENARLQRQQQMRESVKTDCTEPPTSLDSSEHRTTQPQSPQHQARPNLGASLLSLGSSIKIPLTKMVRSRSDVSVTSRANLEEEEMLKGIATSAGNLDDIAASDAECTYSNNSEEGTLQRVKKAQRRWSTGDGWKQKIADESAEGALNVRRWGSHSLDDLNKDEEGKGISGWLNGFSLFGKVDEEVDGDETSSWNQDVR